MISKPKAICGERGKQMNARVYVALGSNLGDREGRIREAIERMRKAAAGPVAVSGFHETKAEHMGRVPDFINAAVSFETALSPGELLAFLQNIEVDMGRPAGHARNESRTIDLDIICYDNQRIDRPDLVVPHPKAHERAFVLVPLAEIAPDLRLPGCTVTVKELSQRG